MSEKDNGGWVFLGKATAFCAALAAVCGVVYGIYAYGKSDGFDSRDREVNILTAEIDGLKHVVATALSDTDLREKLDHLADNDAGMDVSFDGQTVFVSVSDYALAGTMKVQLPVMFNSRGAHIEKVELVDNQGYLVVANNDR